MDSESPPGTPPPPPSNIEQLFHVGSNWLQIISFTLGPGMDYVTEQLPKLPPLNAAPLRGDLILIIAVKILGTSPGLPANLSCALWLWIAEQRWPLRQADNYKLY